MLENLATHGLYEAVDSPLALDLADRVEREIVLVVVQDRFDFGDLDVPKSFTRSKTRLVSSIRDAFTQDRSVDGSALASVLRYHYCAGIRPDGTVIEPNDPNWGRLTSVAKAAQSQPEAWPAMDLVYGEVGRDVRPQIPFSHWLTVLRVSGVEQALATCQRGEKPSR